MIYPEPENGRDGQPDSAAEPGPWVI
jgi:hypothetical protein